jgi:hypothetical protein
MQKYPYLCTAIQGGLFFINMIELIKLKIK